MMVDFHPNISVIISNAHGLSNPIKRQDCQCRPKDRNTNICCLTEIYLNCKEKWKQKRKHTYMQTLKKVNIKILINTKMNLWQNCCKIGTFPDDKKLNSSREAT